MWRTSLTSQRRAVVGIDRAALHVDLAALVIAPHADIGEIDVAITQVPMIDTGRGVPGETLPPSIGTVGGDISCGIQHPGHIRSRESEHVMHMPELLVAIPNGVGCLRIAVQGIVDGVSRDALDSVLTGAHYEILALLVLGQPTQ